MASQLNNNDIRECCCLCGDVGFIKDLILCPNCRSRLQHTYCSRFYPEIEIEKWRCEWCLYDEEKRRDGGSPPEELLDKKLRRRRDEEKLSDQKSRRNTKKQKLNCNSSSSKVIGGRRYKLLADVLC